MRKLILTTVTISILAVLFLAIRPGVGFYIDSLDIIVCFGFDDCNHEKGHRLDRSLDYVSQTDEFKTITNNYLQMCREGLDLRDLPDDLSDTAFDVLAGRAVVCDILLNFPGITEPYSSYDNLVQEYFYGYKDLNGWGGYNEFFASLNEFSEYIILPYEFQQFYE